MACGKGKLGKRSHLFSCVRYAFRAGRAEGAQWGPRLRGTHRGAFGFVVERQILHTPKCSDEKHGHYLIGNPLSLR